MKLLFFLLALFLILLRAGFSIIGHEQHNDNNGTMTISMGDYYAQIRWSGKVIFAEDENSIASIQPGGYLKFKENDAKLLAESNLQGEISYQLYDGHNDLPLNDSGKRFISACIKKMTGWGLNASGRAERINKKAGYHGLIAELPNLKMENIKVPYLDLLSKNDSLSKDEFANIIKQMTTSVNDIDKENFLKRISPGRRKDSSISAAYFDIIAGINADIQKVNLLSRLIDTDSLPAGEFNRIMDITRHFNADIDKQTIYNKLIDNKDLPEQQWLLIIDAAAKQNADIDKSNLLIRIAQKMPRTENTKTAYRAAAKKINNDADYGRAIKIIE